VLLEVTDVLRDRMHEAGGLERMATVSVIMHGLVVAAVLLAPGMWIKPAPTEPKTTMTISLGGGAPGPVSGGFTPEGGPPVQVQRPPEEAVRPDAVRPPAAKTPEMTLPEKNAKPLKNAPTPVKEAPADARGKTPMRGAETTRGSAAAETAVRGTGFGLSTGGDAGAGVSLNMGDFCCPDYLTTVVRRIRTVWDPRVGANGLVIVRFTIDRGGLIRDVTLEQSGGNVIMDLRAQSAVVGTRQLPPLPREYTNPTLTLRLNFRYQ
jgi:TonB family protein